MVQSSLLEMLATVSSVVLEVSGITGPTDATGLVLPPSDRLASRASICWTRAWTAVMRVIKSFGKSFRPCCISCMSASTALAAVKDGNGAVVVCVDNIGV